MKITFIGSGNIAQQLAPAFKKRGFTVQEICSRNVSTGNALAKRIRAFYSNDISKIKNTDVIIIAVKDDAISEVVKKLPVQKNCLVIHTSGATDISVLKKKFKNCGVFWQIQTIKARTIIDFKKVPLVIEASNLSSEKKIKQLAHSLSNKVHVFTSRQRRILHLSAAISNNFVNHFYVLAENILKHYRLPYELLGPMILSTAQSGIKDPQTSQTGPAKRNDKKTMKAHLQLLPKKYRPLYRMVSKSIIESV
ncbi:MAG TPA: DUF2520 domain-containing protein [Bacteroidia bacterium]